MRKLLLRGDYQFEESLLRMVRGTCMVLPPGIYMGRADAAIMVEPTPDEVLLEVEKGRIVCPDARIIVIGGIYTRLIAVSLSDRVYTASSAEEAAAIILARNPERKGLKLTEKESLLLAAMEKGMCNSELTAALSMSDRTVRRIKGRLLDKTGLVSSEQLAVFSALLNQYSQLLT